MNAVGIDVSKGKSKIAIIRPFGEVVAKPFYEPVDDRRKMLKTYNRQLSGYTKIKTMLKNNLISLLDQTFPGANELFSSPAREKDGHEKWIDFVAAFPHCHCVASLSKRNFAIKYEKWCHKNGYNFCPHKAEQIYSAALNCLPTLPNDDFSKTLISSSVSQLNSLCETIAAVKAEMIKIASELPEYGTVLAMHGVGKTLAPQLIAEIGNIRCFPKRSSLARFAGIEPPENQSGTYNQHSRRISKQGSPHLRKALFQVMCCVLQLSHEDEPIFQFLDRKRSEGKPYKGYMIAGANKFLRIYYARVCECLAQAA